MDLPPFWLLVREHSAELMSHARRLAGPDADDVLQEALLRALRSYPRLRAADHLRAWLYRIVTTTAFDHSARRREIASDRLPERAADPEVYDGAFEALIEPLGPAAREALKLRYVDDLDHAGIARRLGVSETAARQRVSSAVRELRRRMA